MFAEYTLPLTMPQLLGTRLLPLLFALVLAAVYGLDYFETSRLSEQSRMESLADPDLDSGPSSDTTAVVDSPDAGAQRHLISVRPLHLVTPHTDYSYTLPDIRGSPPLLSV